MKTLVLGIGNLLCSDDGVGLHIIEKLREENMGMDLKEASSGLDILDAVKGYDRVILVDAIRSGGEPGTIYELSPEDFKERGTLHSFSTHINMDFLEMLELGKKLFPGKMPGDIVIIAIEAKDTMTISDRCTDEVEKALPKAIDMIKGLLS